MVLMDPDRDFNSHRLKRTSFRSHKISKSKMRSPTVSLILLVLLPFNNGFQFMSKWKAPMTTQEIADRKAVEERFGDKSTFRSS